MNKQRNLIEDEKEARNERLMIRVALASIIVGLLFFWIKYRKQE